MSRRFLHLVVRRSDPWGRNKEYALRRLDTSRLFPPRNPTGEAPPAAAMVEAKLPRAGAAFYKPSEAMYSGHMDGPTVIGGGTDKVVGADAENRNSFLLLLYRRGADHAVRVLPSMLTPKCRPIAFSIGDSATAAVYVIDSAPARWEEAKHCFEALVHGFPPEKQGGAAAAIEDWHWRSLPPPPYVLDAGGGGKDGEIPRVAAHAVVGDAQIWVSTERHGTYAFDTASGAWSKAGDWKLPFRGRAEHVPEHGLWFGFSDDNDDGGGHLVAADLASTPPVLRRTWKHRASPSPAPVASYVVPLGGGRLCVAEVFETMRVEVGGRPIDANKKKKASKTTATTRRWGFKAAVEEEEEEETEVTERFAVVSSVELSGGGGGGKAVRMARRGVRRYVINTETFVTREAKRRGGDTVRRLRLPRAPTSKCRDEKVEWVF